MQRKAGFTLIQFLVVLCAFMVVLPRAAHAQIQFAPVVSYDVGTSVDVFVDSVSSADFNGDGFPDVAVPTLEGVSLLMNNRDGTLSAPVRYTLNGSKRAVIAEDLNADGYSDLAVLGGGLDVMMNQGDGTFAAPVLYSGGTTFVAGDFYGDGRVHLAVLVDRLFAPQEIRMLRNRGDGTFSQSSLRGPGACCPNGISAGDLDNDGFDDLVVTVSGSPSGSVFVLINNRDGTFDLPLNYTIGNGYAATPADVDGDDNLDLIFPQINTNAVVMLNQGGGTFAAPVFYDAGGFGRYAATDLDGDGNLDLATNINGQFGVSVLKNNWNGTFAAPVIFETLPDDRSSESPTIAVDLDRDGRPDLVTLNNRHNPLGREIYVFINQTPFPPSTPSIFGVIANHGGNVGTVSVRVRGRGFFKGAEVKLTGLGPDIIGTNTRVKDRFLLTTTFDLRSATPGVRDVVVTNPDGVSATLAGGFTVEKGGKPEIWIDIIGPSVIRGGAKQPYFIVIGNRGNVDAAGVPLTIALPKWVGTRLGFEITPPPPLGGQDSIDWSKVPIWEDPEGDNFLFLWFPFLSASYNASLTISLTVPNDPDFAHRLFPLCVWFGPLWIKEFSGLLVEGDRDAIDCLVAAALTALGPILPALTADAVTATAISIFLNYLNFVRTNWNQLTTRGVVGTEIGLILRLIEELARDKGVSISLSQGIGLARQIIGLLLACDKVNRKIQERCHSIEIITSYDPNELIGSSGFGDTHWLSGDEPLRYFIFFENKSTATASAREVIITDFLDVSNLDLSTFTFGPIAFGDKEVIPHPGLTDFNTSVVISQNLHVHINMHLDPDTGLVTWRFTSIDPRTGEPPADPRNGFLPPGVGGNVFFTVQPKRGLPTGTVVHNQAAIVFDFNAPLFTNDWFNTLDNTKPTSHVLDLPAIQPTRFTVRWAGDDEGSGIKDYTIYVSDDFGPYVPWLVNTTETSAVFEGQVGHTYAFYAVSRDNVNNIEDAPDIPDAVTTVVAGVTDITAQVQVTRGGFRYNRATQRYVQQVTLTNISSNPIQGTVSLVLDNLSSNAELFNATDYTASGSPYINVNVGSDNVLSPGESASVILDFKNPSNRSITYTTRVLAGEGTRLQRVNRSVQQPQQKSRPKVRRPQTRQPLPRRPASQRKQNR